MNGRTARPSVNYERLKGLEHSAAPYCLALQIYILCHLHEKETTECTEEHVGASEEGATCVGEGLLKTVTSTRMHLI